MYCTQNYKGKNITNTWSHEYIPESQKDTKPKKTTHNTNSSLIV